MSHRDVMLALALGAGTGLMFAAAGTAGAGGLILTYFAVLPIFVVGLRGGAELQGAAVAVALLVAGVFAGAIGGILLAFTFALPAHLLTWLALRRAPDGTWYPLGRVVTAGSILGALIAVAVCLYVGSMAKDGATMEATVAASIEEMLARLFTFDTEMGAEQRTIALARAKQTAQTLAAILPGMVASSWLLMIALNGAIAQALLTAGKRALRPTPRLHDMLLPTGMLVAIGIAVAVAVAGGDTLGYIAANVAVVLAAAFLLQGLGVVHTALRLWTAGRLPFVVFYVVLGIFGWLAIPIVALGLAEPLVHVRDRLKRRKDGGRS